MNIVTVIIIIIFADQGQVKIHGRKTLLKWSVRPSARAFLVKRKLENTVNSKKITNWEGRPVGTSGQDLRTWSMDRCLSTAQAKSMIWKLLVH